MPGFATYDAIINALTTGKGQRKEFSKLSAGTVAAASSQDLWVAPGNPPAGVLASVLGTGVAKSGADAGAIAFASPTAPATEHLLSFGAGSSVSLGTLLLYDRLAEYPFDSTVTSLTTFTQPTIPSRDLNGAALGAGVQIMVEKRLAAAVSAQTLTLIYVDQDGVSRTQAGVLRVGEAIVGNLASPTGSPFFWPLVTPAGVRSITSAQMTTSAGAGSGLTATLVRPIAYLPVMAANSYVERDLVMQLPALPRIFNDSALGLALLANATTSPVFGGLVTAEG